MNGPNDSECEHVTLVTCLQFISFAMLQGNRPGALAHLCMGLRILLTLVSPSIYLESDKDRMWFRNNSRSRISNLDKLVDTYARLDYECTMFGEQSPILTLASPRDKMGPSPQIPTSFMDIVYARRSLGILSNTVYRLRDELLQVAATDMGNESHGDWAVRSCEAHSRIQTVDLSKHASLLQHQSCLKFGLVHWASAFKVLSSNLCRCDPRLVILLEIQHFSINFLTCTLHDIYEEDCDCFKSTFQRMVDLGNEFVDAISSKRVSSGPQLTFTLEWGIIPSLYLVAMKCRNSKIRHDAIALLGRTQCQEGVWEGSLIARFVAEVAKMEEEAGDTEGGRIYNCNNCIPESARFSDVVIAVSETPGYGRLVCARYAHESTGGLRISERTFQF